MPRLKKMPNKIRKELESVAERIASGENLNIAQMGYLDWVDTSENDLLFFSIESIFATDEENIIAIAMMLTMPSSILNHECSPLNK